MAALDDPQALVDRVRAATGEVTAQGILEAILQPLLGRFAVDRASIRMVVPDSALLELVAVWTSGPTILGVGARMSSGSTAYPDVLASRRPELRTNVDPREGLLDEIMSMEGVRSYVTLPLRDRERVVGLFSLSSKRAGTFREEDLPFLEDLATLVAFGVAGPL